jgi:leader peptidase (prepilin peptidase)/N-methyltransferase
VIRFTSAGSWLGRRRRAILTSREEGEAHGERNARMNLSAESMLVFVLGACIGSFLNVVIHRLPRGESLVSPRSRCPSCQRTLAWYENLPIVSWLGLRGRCRTCRAGISLRYPLIELMTGLAAVALYARLGFSLHFLAAFYFACTLLAIAYIDLDFQIIPDVLSLSGLAVGLAAAPLLHPGTWLDALGRAAAGALLGGGILFAVAWTYERATGRVGMGGGDIKLLAMVGAFLGWQGVLLTLLLGSLVGSAIGIAIMLARGADAKLAIPFGPFLSIGAFVALFWGGAIVSWYLASSGLAT